MAVADAMFIFEVVVSSVESLVDSRLLIIRSDFADVFSLELKDPKQMRIVIPDPPPLPPDPPGKKKGKKPKPKKPKKGKKGAIQLPPPEPVIQSGQSLLFASTAPFLIQTMKKFPLELSLWSKEDNMVFIGSNNIPWDPMFYSYLEAIMNTQPAQPVTLNEVYNIFEEGTARRMAKIGIQIKLTHLGDKVTSCFRTLSEDPAYKKVLYTGMNSKTTSYMCTLKTTAEEIEQNSNKIETNYHVDKPKPKNIVYASFKNAPATNLTFFNDGDYCCMGHADKPPESIYKSPETLPDINFITDYVRKIIVSCNDNMRMLTPRPTIRPRIKATDIDRLCYCKETNWPEDEFAQKFKKEVQSSPCPMCIEAGKVPKGPLGTTFDLANLRGPCGKHDCRIARDLRAYIEKLVEEDSEEFNINDVVGPCGSHTCTLAEKIQEFLRHEGVFSDNATKEGLSTQCNCLERMQQALIKKPECDDICSKSCDDSSGEGSMCGGKSCSNNEKREQIQKVYNVYYFTVELDNDTKTLPSTPSSPPSVPSSENLKFKHCPPDCPSMKASEVLTCSKSVCSSTIDKKQKDKCQDPKCPDKREEISPADSNIEIDLDDIHNPCCVKSCDVAEKVKEFIVDTVMSKKKTTTVDDTQDPCYCDCDCTFKFSKKTTYCAVCGGYECMGDDLKDEPEYLKPQPCPLYHKLYNKKYIKTISPWPDEDESKDKKTADTQSIKSAKQKATKAPEPSPSIRNASEKKITTVVKKPKPEKESKPPANVNKKEPAVSQLKIETKKKLSKSGPRSHFVPKHMGWDWKAEDIPGMKPRPQWKPGASHKVLVRRYRALREGIDIIAKKKRALLQRKKKLEPKPLIVVNKKDGEYTVQMEVFKKYSKERLIFQYPYEDRQPLIYTIGKTQEEKDKIQRKRDRRNRRETRRKCRLLQSTFRDKCEEICEKAYQQAIGVLPLPNPNSPECPCQTRSAHDISSPTDSCSCSDEGSISTSDTDGDEWTIEFTPPVARWDPKVKHSPTLTENESQYNYLDYKVKLLDKQGNQVPRYFIGPDGKQECSDLGGFWGPDHLWMDINKDGYIGPDNRWVPMNFTGPDGVTYSAEDGFFVDSNGQNLKIGVDGYIDKDGKWAWYKKRPRSVKSTATTIDTKKTGLHGRGDAKAKVDENAKGTTIKGVSAVAKSKPDDKKSALSSKSPGTGGGKVVSISAKGRSALVMSVSANFVNKGFGKVYRKSAHNLKVAKMQNAEKNPAEAKKIARYNEIMKDLQMYADIGEIKPPKMASRACNTAVNGRNQPCATTQNSFDNCCLIMPKQCLA